MKVLFFTSWYPRPRSKYSGIFFRELAQVISEKADEVIVACVHVKFIGKIDKIGLVQTTYGSVKEYMWYVPALIPKWKYYYDILGRYYTKMLYKKIIDKHGKPDIIHAHSALNAAYNVAKLKIDPRIPIVYTEHSSTILNEKYTAQQKRQIQEAVDKASCVTAVSRALGDKLENFGKMVTVIPNLVDTKKFRITKKNKTNAFKFVYLGNIRQDKGVVILVRAFCEEFAINENVSLSIGGDGEYLKALQSLIKSFKCEDRVMLAGAISRDDVSMFLSEGDCFVLPSRYETFGIVCIEAASCGLPLIGTRCGGIEEIINEQNGILIDVDDVIALRQAMRYMRNNAHIYSPELIREDIVKRFGKESVAIHTMEVYSKVICEETKTNA